MRLEDQDDAEDQEAPGGAFYWGPGKLQSRITKHLLNYLEPGPQWPNARKSQLALRFCDMPKNPVPILSGM